MNTDFLNEFADAFRKIQAELTRAGDTPEFADKMVRHFQGQLQEVKGQLAAVAEMENQAESAEAAAAAAAGGASAGGTAGGQAEECRGLEHVAELKEKMLAAGALPSDVRTPPEVVNAMLQLAGVGPKDVVYDLGCGDGRIVIAAAKASARAVGLELDPQLFETARANALKAGVEKLVSIRQADARAADLSEATVVTLFMSEKFNLQMRDMLRRRLRPGARIVSHEFDMGDWQPMKSQTATDDQGRQHRCHLWTIAKDDSNRKPDTGDSDEWTFLAEMG